MEIFIKALLVISAAVFLCLGSGYVGGRLSKKGIDSGALFSLGDKYGPAALKMAGLLEGMLPEPFRALSKAVTAVVIAGTAAAEQLWKDGKLPGDQRKAAALERINSGLDLLKITPSPELEKVLSVACDLAVKLFLPPSHPSDPEEIASAVLIPAPPSEAAQG
jgi:hypothetical protein